MMFHRPINETDAPKFQRDVRSAVVQMAAHTRQVLTTVVRRGASGTFMHGWVYEATDAHPLLPDERIAQRYHPERNHSKKRRPRLLRRTCVAYPARMSQPVACPRLQLQAPHARQGCRGNGVHRPPGAAV